MDRRLAQNSLNMFLKTSLEAFSGSICLFLPLTPRVLQTVTSTASQKHHKIMWQIGRQCHCISRKTPLLELNLRQDNNIGKDLLYNFCFGFWNKPLVWNNCCQIACICTVIARISEWKAICCKPFKSPLYYSLVTWKPSHKLCAHTY